MIAKFNRIACTGYYFEKLLVAFGARGEVEAICHGFSEHTLHEHILWSLYRVFRAPSSSRWSPRSRSEIAMGMSRARPAGCSTPSDRVLPADPAACVPAAHHHLVRDRGVRQALPHLSRLLRADCDQRPGRRALGVDRADPRRLFHGSHPQPGARAGGHQGGPARNPHRHAGRDRLRLDDPRRGRDGRGEGRLSG